MVNDSRYGSIVDFKACKRCGEPSYDLTVESVEQCEYCGYKKAVVYAFWEESDATQLERGTA